MSQKVIAHVQNITAKHYNVKIDRMNSRSRLRDVLFARQIGFYILHKYYRVIYKDIADAYGGRHHSTVLHSVKVIENFISIKDPKTCNDLNEIFTKVKALTDCDTTVYICLSIKMIDIAKFGNEMNCEKELINFVRKYTPAY